MQHPWPQIMYKLVELLQEQVKEMHMKLQMKIDELSQVHQELSATNKQLWNEQEKLGCP
jgi:hypothetical protein